MSSTPAAAHATRKTAAAMKLAQPSSSGAPAPTQLISLRDQCAPPPCATPLTLQLYTATPLTSRPSTVEHASPVKSTLKTVVASVAYRPAQSALSPSRASRRSAGTSRTATNTTAHANAARKRAGSSGSQCSPHAHHAKKLTNAPPRRFQPTAGMKHAAAKCSASRQTVANGRSARSSSNARPSHSPIPSRSG